MNYCCATKALSCYFIDVKEFDNFLLFLLLGTIIYGYNFNFSRVYELTFISNSSCGLLLLTDGIVWIIEKKSLPILLYQCVLLCINTVFFTIFFKLFGWHDFNFSGGFLFMHGINPIIF